MSTRFSPPCELTNQERVSTNNYKMTIAVPNECLYISNLPQKVNKEGISSLTYSYTPSHNICRNEETLILLVYSVWTRN